jgi:elongation factor Ts
MEVNLDKLKELREETNAGVMDCRRALEDARGDIVKAKEILLKQGLKLAEEKAGRTAGDGVVSAYIHSDHRIGVLLELGCETDFVARTEAFQNLAYDLAMQVAATDPESVDQLMEQEFIKDTNKTIRTLLVEAISSLGENIVVRRFERYTIGD